MLHEAPLKQVTPDGVQSFIRRRMISDCGPLYTARNTSHGTPPLDRTQLFTDGRVQDHAALPGQRPSVPSSRPDAAIANQNNTLSWVQALF
eukprot:scaffold211520_cov17-Tisochrysis_lutea.AAC.3